MIEIPQGMMNRLAAQTTWKILFNFKNSIKMLVYENIIKRITKNTKLLPTIEFSDISTLSRNSFL
jgi:hypothetical protein